MERSTSDALFLRYKRLIGYAAHLYARRSPSIDADDMFQDGCLMLLEYFRDRTDTTDDRVHNTFKKSLFLWMQRTAMRRIKQARPTGRAMIRLGYQVDEMGNDRYDHEPNVIHVDEMLATVDTCVLTKLYAKEFVAELRRVLGGTDRMIFELIVESVETGDTNGDVARTAAEVTGTAVSTVYKRIGRIRDAALRVLNRAS